MNEEKASKPQKGTSPAKAVPPQKAERSATPPQYRHRTSAGAVIRRAEDPDQPGSWRIAQRRSPHSNVDTLDKQDGHPQSNNGVGTSDKSERRPPKLNNVGTLGKSRPLHYGVGTSGKRHPDKDRVDITDETDLPMNDKGFSHKGNGNDADARQQTAGAEIEFLEMDAPPKQSATKKKGEQPVLTKLVGPRNWKARGPDGNLVKKLRDAHKKRVADRAKARGRDPGAGSTETAPGVTRSEKTHQQYLKRGRLLVLRFRRETGNTDEGYDNLNPVEFVNWLFSLKPTLKATAWRPYRQSAKAILSSLPHDETEAALAMLDADIGEAGTSEPKKKASSKQDVDRDKLPRRTSSRKEKKFPKEDFDRIISYLKHFSRSGMASLLVDWLIAGVATGLRPIEWQATDVEVREDPNAPGGRHVWLYVLNAKATNGRANGVVRTLNISGFRDETIRVVQRMSRNGNEFLIDGVYDTKQSQCSQLLYSVSEKLFKKKKVYSLYSARHQFVANAKSYHKPESVSALVGHVVTETAVSSYGKKRSCWGPDEIVDRPEPVQEEVATVRQQHVFFEERIRMQQEAGLLKAPKPSSMDEA